MPVGTDLHAADEAPRRSRLTWMAAAAGALAMTVLAHGLVSQEPGEVIAGLAIAGLLWAGHREVGRLLRRGDEGLASSHARYELVAEAASDLIVLFDPGSDEVLYASPSCGRLLGILPGSVPPRETWSVIHPDDVAGSRALVEGALREGSRRGMARLRHADGRWLSFEVAADAVRHRGRRVVALVARDVTAQRALQEQLAQSQKLEIVGRMAGGFAHDFNNLLTVARSTAEFARSALAPEHPARRDLDDLVDATVRGAGLVRSLLQLAKKEQPDRNARCTAEKVIGDLGRLLPRLLGAKIRYGASIEPGLRPVVGQAVQIEQIILNLALNARDAMPDGGELTVRAFRVAADDPGESARVGLEVRDTGTGIPPEVMARLFEPFFTTKAPGVGTGLGLATSRSIAQGPGGDLRVWTEPGKGTAFTLELPEAGEPQLALPGA